MPQRGHRDGLGIDRIRLAGLSSTTAGAGHQPGRDSHHSVPGAQQVTLQAAGQMPAVLQCKSDLRPLRSPLHQQQVAFAGRCHRLLTEATPDVINSDHRMGALMRIRSNHDHAELPCSSTANGSAPSSAGTPQSSIRQAPIKPRITVAVSRSVTALQPSVVLILMAC